MDYYSYRIGHKVKRYDIQTGNYGSHCGLTDLYPECESKLKSILEYGEDFYTDWGSKKELLSASILRFNGEMEIKVSAWVDDLWDSDDLIYDAYWEATGLEDELPAETIDEIRNAAFACDCDDQYGMAWKGEPVDYDRIMEIVSDLADHAMDKCNESYKKLVQIVSELV